MAGQRKTGGRVSERDREIYRLARSGARTQRELRQEEKKSEPSRRERLEAVRALHIERLESLYEEALQAWEDSHLPRVTICEKVVNGEVIVTRTTTTQPGDCRWLKAAEKIACQLADFRSQGRGADSRVVDSHVVEHSGVADRRLLRANIDQIIPNSPKISEK